MDNNKKHCKYTTPIILPKREREKKKLEIQNVSLYDCFTSGKNAGMIDKFLLWLNPSILSQQYRIKAQPAK